MKTFVRPRTGAAIDHRGPPSILLSVAVGAAALVTAVGAKALLVAWTGGDPAYLTLFAVLPVAVLGGGFLSGSILVVVGALLDSVLFQSPVGSIWIVDPDARLRFVIFVSVGLWIAWLTADVANARAAAAQTALRVERLLDALPDPTFVTEPVTRRIEYANRAALEGSGPRASLRGVDIESVIPGWSALVDKPATELSLVRPDADDVPVGVLASTVTFPGREDRVLTIAHDLSERIDAEVRLMRLASAERAQARMLGDVITSMEDGVALLGDDGSVLVANLGLSQLIGAVTSRAELEAALGAPLQDGDIRLPGSEAWTRVRVRALGDDATRNVLVTVRDISDEIESVAIRDAFLGVLSHELRTPVTTILGYSQVARRKGRTPGASAEALIDDIAAEAERLHYLIEDLLVLSRAQAGAVPFEAEPLLVQHVLPEVIRSEGTRHPKVTFTAKIEDTLPPVEGDRTYVGQILRNLISNAAKYGPADRSTVLVTAEQRDGVVEVRVLDNGPGFEPGDEERLFEIFYRAPQTAKHRAGSGIGLYVTRTLAEAMGGKVWARRRPTGGSEFGVALRIAVADDEDTDEDAWHPGSGGD